MKAHGATTSQALRGGAIAGATAAAMYAVGEATGFHNATLKDFLTPAHFANMLGHAVVGCASATLSGGGCRGAAIGGAMGSFATPLAAGAGVVGGFFVVTAAGGVGSQLAGGDFGDGARTAAYGYLYNQCAQVKGGCWSALKDAAYMTFDWATGQGDNSRVFGPGSIQVTDMKDAPGVNGARELYYKKYPTSEPTGSVTNYGASFGLTGWFDSDGLFNTLSPTRQFVGSYSVNIFTVDQGQTLMFVLNNNSSMKSFLYGIGPAYERSRFGAGGNMRQTYWWTEPRR